MGFLTLILAAPEADRVCCVFEVILCASACNLFAAILREGDGAAKVFLEAAPNRADLMGSMEGGNGSTVIKPFGLDGGHDRTRENYEWPSKQ